MADELKDKEVSAVLPVAKPEEVTPPAATVTPEVEPEKKDEPPRKTPEDILRESMEALEKQEADEKAKAAEAEAKDKKQSPPTETTPPATASATEVAELKRKLEEAQQALAQAKAGSGVQPPPVQPEAAKPAPDAAPAKPAEKRYPPEQVFGLLARIASGEFTEAREGEADAYRREALAYVATRMTPEEISGVLLNAQQGLYGPASEAMATLCKENLPVAIVRQQKDERENIQRQELTQRRQQAWAETFKRVPELSNKESQQYKDFAAANEVLAGVIPDLWHRADAPALVADFMQLRTKAQAHESVSAQLKAAQDEIAALKKQLGLTTRPQSPSTTVPAGKKTATPEDSLRAGLQAAGVANAA